jgi:hypothetical protein
VDGSEDEVVGDIVGIAFGGSALGLDGEAVGFTPGGSAGGCAGFSVGKSVIDK